MSKVINIRIGDALLESIDAKARADRRSRSAVILLCLEDEFGTDESLVEKPVEAVPKIRKGKRSVVVQEPAVEPENAMDEDIEAMMPEMCPYTEYNTDTGETYACALEVHGPKIRHKMGAKVG